MPRAKQVCSRRGCPEITDGGRCPAHRAQAEQTRGTAAQRGYDARWRAKRAAYLRRYPICVLDGAIATVADHWPESRRELLARGVSDPDADHRLRPVCAPCHNKETTVHQPGGWNAR
jgi:5-methylcytosine-specific restriction protein A